MFGFFRNRIKSVADIGRLLKAEDPVKAGEILRSEADKGNLICQISLSQLYLGMMDQENNPVVLRDLTKKFVNYSEMAALQGDASTQYNLAKHLLTVVTDDIRAGDGKMSEGGRDLLRESKKYLLMAAAQNLQEAMESLSSLNELFEWAESQEYV
jgi:TPR repeat protein